MHVTSPTTAEASEDVQYTFFSITGMETAVTALQQILGKNSTYNLFSGVLDKTVRTSSSLSPWAGELLIPIRFSIHHDSSREIEKFIVTTKPIFGGRRRCVQRYRRKDAGVQPVVWVVPTVCVLDAPLNLFQIYRAVLTIRDGWL